MGPGRWRPSSPTIRRPGPLSAVLTDSEWSTAVLDTQRAPARYTPVYVR
jgi:para-nitrobenzyl esterase